MDRKIAIIGTGDEMVDTTDVPAPIRDSATTGFEPVLEHVPGAVFPDSPQNRDLTIKAYVEAGRALAKKNYAALYINTVGDYGLQSLRREMDAPMTGSGEASIRAALSIGESFSIVTIWPQRMKFIYDHVLEESKSTYACRQICFLSEDDELGTMGQGDDFYSNMRTCQITTLEKIKSTIERNIQEHRVDSVILGCTCMSHLGPRLAAEGYPVIEPMVAGYRHLESLVRL